MKTIKISVIFYLIILILCSTVNTERYENITACWNTVLPSSDNFEFVCEPNKPKADFFDYNYRSWCSGQIDYYTRSNRDGIFFTDCYLKELPNIFQSHANIQFLNVSFTGLEIITSNDFRYATRLLNFIASHNNLTKIPANLLPDSRKINFLDFSFNQIKTIDTNAFADHNRYVQIFDLSNNLLKTIDNQVFRYFKHMRQMHLQNNLIEELIDGPFHAMPYLQTLDLSGNRLKSINCGDFPYFQSLTELQLSRNYLTELNTNCIRHELNYVLFIAENKLTSLNISQNLSEIHAAANQIEQVFIENDLKNIKILDLVKNPIKNVSGVIKLLGEQLKSLSISNCVIDELDENTFASFPHLELLWIRNVSILSIPEKTFNHQKLRHLDIGDNGLDNIDVQIINWNLKQLETLYLDGNQLTNVDHLTKEYFPNLKYLNIENNEFDCDYLWKVTRNLIKNHTRVEGIECHEEIMNEINMRMIDTTMYSTTIKPTIQAIIMPMIKPVQHIECKSPTYTFQNIIALVCLVIITVVLVCFIAIKMKNHFQKKYPPKSERLTVAFNNSSDNLVHA